MRDLLNTTFLILYILSTPIIAAGLILLLSLPQNLYLFIALVLLFLLLPVFLKLSSYKH